MGDTTPRYTILIVDDEVRMRRVIADYLRIKDFRTIEASDGVEALEQFHREHPDLVLLDVMMPRMNGWEVCKEIRRVSQTPILMLTAKSEEDDELLGFELGADEYIGKPFSLKILSARIEAVLRRHTDTDDPALSLSLLRVDPLAREVYVDNMRVELTYTEFELLSYLMANKGIALSRDKILDGVWQYDYCGDARTVDTHIKKLRSKLGEAGEMIKTIRGIGYKFEA
ncbi:MAG: response regulator transcription factor [Clostridia bacterium]|nr:response regulator transcription factor [Clostridia bacterium]